VKADLHVHTVLSPCGDLDMSPRAIIAAAKRRGIEILGITDHNSTRQIPVMQQVARQEGILLLAGVEVATREEVHCLAFFPGDEQLNAFQHYLDLYLPAIPNDPARFGYQVVVDADDQILYEETRLLISAIDQGIEEIERAVHALDGLFIPAHVDKSRNSIFSQLGFIPPTLACDALEISARATPSTLLATTPRTRQHALLQSSDAHYLHEIGTVYTELHPRDDSFEAIRDAVRTSRSVWER
jgi:PHP family Zn ribbon phosphoesterase